MKRLLIVLTIMFFSQTVAYSMNMRELFYEAIKNGTVEDTLDPEVAKVFNATIKSDNPTKLKVKKIKRYEGDCALLNMEFKNESFYGPDGKIVLDDVTHKPLPFNLNFNLPICINGSTPQEALKEEQDRRARAVTLCKVSVIHGSHQNDLHATNGEIKFSNCPKDGHVKAVFNPDGCPALVMAPNTHVRFNFDKNGELSTKIMVPDSCLSPKKTKIEWTLYIYENLQHVMENQVGFITKSW